MFWFALATVVSLPQDTTQPARPLDRVLAFDPSGVSGQPIEYDRGAAAVWQLLLKLQTTASVLHTTAHPDDEHVGLLTRLSRGEGTRTALLAINRGEGGANAIGPELFDALGIIRAEELRLAGSYYGLDDLYFTTAIDYGFSKTLEEARRSWDFDAVLADMVRVIRLNRPLVVVSRFHGSPRDGHGHHQSAGVLTPLAIEAAADPARFPGQIAGEGLRPWRVRKLYRGGVRDGEAQHVTIDAGQYSPWLGDTYEAVGRYGVSLQRSQTAGRMRTRRGPALYRYERLAPDQGSDGEGDLFDGLNISVSGIFDLTGEQASDSTRLQMRELETTLSRALNKFSFIDPARSVAPLLSALKLTRRLLADRGLAAEARFLLLLKERQIQRALVAASSIEAAALAMGNPEGVVVHGETLGVEIAVTGHTSLPVRVDSIAFVGSRRWTSASDAGTFGSIDQETRVFSFSLAVDDDDASIPYLHRERIVDNRYTVRDSADLHLSAGRAALVARIWFGVDETPVSTEVTVRSQASRLPNGYIYPEVTVLPPVSVAIEPRMVVARWGEALDREVEVVITNHQASGVTGTLEVEAPAGVHIAPPSIPFAISEAGGRYTGTFRIARVAVAGDGDVFLRAAATVGGTTIGTEYVAISHDDIETRYFARPATAVLRSIDVIAPMGLEIGYVMGVGDEVPAAIEQLGAKVRLLSADDLESADLSEFHAIVIGTRAYAVRPDLITHNNRLLQFAEDGGHLIVLYQTQEFVPDRMAPFPADLPRGAEEVSEEDAPVEILAPDHPLLAGPNAIVAGDFGGWIEQRGSKFFSAWSAEYVPLIETHDTGQPPQGGVWLSARVGRGDYTYVALALHRQLPYGVPGAYRILANLLFLSAEP